MAKTIAKPPDSNLYDRDFSAWAREQADLLRARRFEDLDLAHLIEEVGDLGRSERHAVMSRARQILQHCLKLEHSPAQLPRRGWQETIATQRSDLEEILTPSLRHELEDDLPQVYARARRDAARDLRQDNVAAQTLPDACPYGIEQILDPEWLPENIHSVEDPAG